MPNGDIEFFLPGERVINAPDGLKYVCGAGGNWVRDYSSVSAPAGTALRIQQVQRPVRLNVTTGTVTNGALTHGTVRR
jgi:hypothetical protein